MVVIRRPEGLTANKHKATPSGGLGVCRGSREESTGTNNQSFAEVSGENRTIQSRFHLV